MGISQKSVYVEALKHSNQKFTHKHTHWQKQHLLTCRQTQTHPPGLQLTAIKMETPNSWTHIWDNVHTRGRLKLRRHTTLLIPSLTPGKYHNTMWVHRTTPPFSLTLSAAPGGADTNLYSSDPTSLHPNTHTFFPWSVTKHLFDSNNKPSNSKATFYVRNKKLCSIVCVYLCGLTSMKSDKNKKHVEQKRRREVWMKGRTAGWAASLSSGVKRGLN